MMRAFYFCGLLLFVFLALNYPIMAQKPVDSIPNAILRQITNSFYKECYDSLNINKLKKKPVLRQTKSSYEYECSAINPKESLEGYGWLKIYKRILFGDLTNDGKDELIISALANFNGSACFGYEYIFQQSGNEWKLLADYNAIDMFLDNKQVIDCLLVGTILSYDTDDAHCCPSKKEEIRLKYDKQKNELFEVGRKFLGKVK